MSNCNYENYEIYSIFQKQILVQKFVQSGTIRYKLGWSLSRCNSRKWRFFIPCVRFSAHRSGFDAPEFARNLAIPEDLQDQVSMLRRGKWGSQMIRNFCQSFLMWCFLFLFCVTDIILFTVSSTDRYLMSWWHHYTMTWDRYQHREQSQYYINLTGFHYRSKTVSEPKKKTHLLLVLQGLATSGVPIFGRGWFNMKSGDKWW